MLQDSRQVTVEEEVAACLHVLAPAMKNRTIASRFMRSGETISRHFHGVLNPILTLSPNFIRQSGHQTPRGPKYFEDSVGAIDGTHIPAFLPIQAQPSYRNPKGTLSQNVLAACGFDLKFQHVLPGWEGSATDARVLHNALSRSDPLVVPPGRYYLVDAGFANALGFLAPYRGVRYHLKNHRGRTPDNAKELFNKRHSQARNVIERAFGLLKGRAPTKQQRKNNVFNAKMDEMLLELMLEQVALGRKGDRGFKDEAYVAVANLMTAANKSGRVLTDGTIRNRCKNLKKQYAVCTELLNASGFGFDDATKHIMASDEVWRDWIVGHPEAQSWRSRTIDYDKLSLVFGRDVANGQFARSSQNVVPVSDSQSRTNTQALSGNAEIDMDHVMEEMRMSNGGGDGSTGSRKRIRRAVGMKEFINGFKEASGVISPAIEEVARKMLEPSERLSEIVAAELDKIPELSPADLDIAHEWLNNSADSSTAFLHSKDKSAWIFRHLERMHRETGL